jgi:hypothetical protein
MAVPGTAIRWNLLLPAATREGIPETRVSRVYRRSPGPGYIQGELWIDICLCQRSLGDPCGPKWAIEARFHGSAQVQLSVGICPCQRPLEFGSQGPLAEARCF